MHVCDAYYLLTYFTVQDAHRRSALLRCGRLTEQRTAIDEPRTICEPNEQTTIIFDALQFFSSLFVNY